VRIGRNLNLSAHPARCIPNEILARIPVAPPDEEREKQLGVAVDSRPKPETGTAELKFQLTLLWEFPRG
jgi:hypothetical protein